MLVLLQFAMPFLHAHFGRDLSPEGFHIHGLDLARSYNHPPNLQPLITNIRVDGLIVSVGSAVQSDRRSDVSDDSQTIDASEKTFGYSLTYRAINFSPYVFPEFPHSVYPISAPRGPPV